MHILCISLGGPRGEFLLIIGVRSNSSGSSPPENRGAIMTTPASVYKDRQFLAVIGDEVWPNEQLYN
jgi:hypothetical protein